MPRKGNVTRPRIEPMLMIRPSRFWRMEGSTARVTRRSPMTFVSKMTFACSAVKASVTPTDAMPALLTNTSILPASASTVLDILGLLESNGGLAAARGNHDERHDIVHYE